MVDNPSKRGAPYRIRINVNQPYEVVGLQSPRPNILEQVQEFRLALVLSSFYAN
jgi:hypothetical protein